MIDKKLENLYDDLFGSAKDGSLDIDMDAVNKTIEEIFGPEDKGSKASDDQSGKEEKKTGEKPPLDKAKPVESDTPAESETSGQTEARTEQAVEEEETDPVEELDALIGLQAIKHDVKELIAFAKIQKMRSEKGMKSVPVSLHLVFTGNPGTGKTTVARIMAKLYKQIGVLSKGQLVEVDRSGLVAGYVGQTALKTQKKIEEAMGGILFIDEAYALAKEGNDFGQEAVDTVLKAMEDKRGDFIVIVAGYTKPMEHFIESNPGLKSRFNKYIEFADYTMDELTAIFQSFCDKYDYHIDEENLERVKNLLRIKKLQTLENFANGREVRNLFEKIITNQARRLSEADNPSEEDMRTLLYEDLFDEEDKNTTEEAIPSAEETEWPNEDKDLPEEDPEEYDSNTENEEEIIN